MMLVFGEGVVRIRWMAVLPFLVFALCAFVQADPRTAPRLTLSELEFLETQDVGPEGLIVEVPGGSVLPLKLRLKGELATAESEELSLRFHRDIYIYLPGKKNKAPRFSLNGRAWKSWEKLFQGSVSAGASKTKDQESLELVVDWGLR